MVKKGNDGFKQKVEEEEEEETFLEWIKGKAHEKFIEHIPSDSIKDLPGRYILPVGTLAYIAAAFCFAYFIYVGYTTARKQQFISLDEDDGECSVVETTVDGTYYGSRLGYWGGQAGFQYTQALYRVEMQHYKNSEEEYYRQMTELVYPQLKMVARKSTHRNAAENMLIWMAWEARLQPDIPGDHNVLQMTGNPIIVFDRKYFFGTYAGLSGDCLVESDSQYDPSAGLMSLQYSYSEFMDDSICSKVATPSYMGFNPDYDFDFFRTKMDVASLVICVAVNLELLDFKELDMIENSAFNKTVPGTSHVVTFSERFDFRFPGMDPIFCVDAGSLLDHPVCFVRLGDTITIPVFHHYGSSFDEPDSCNCSNPEHSSDQSYCQVFDFMLGSIFYNAPSYFFGEEDVDPDMPYLNYSDIALLQLLRDHTIEDLHHLSYNATYGAIEYGEYTDAAWRKEAYEFCTQDEIGACSIVVFNPYDEELKSVSEFYYQVNHPACRDSFTVTDEAWKALATHPPVELVQEYFACKATVFDALFNSVGIASGNTATFVPMFMLLLLPLIYAYLSYSGNLPPKKEYEQEDLDKATKAFATALLRIRDGKTRGMKKGGALATVAAELIASASVAPAYPDSDDDESDEEDEIGRRQRSFSKSRRKIMGVVVEKNETVEEETDDDDDDEEDDHDNMQNKESKQGFFESMFSLNPMQEESQAPRDVEMANANKPRKKKMKNRTTIKSVNVLNNIGGAQPLKSPISINEIDECIERIKDCLLKAKKVLGRDGADNVFNNAVKTSTELHNVDLVLLKGVKFSAWFAQVLEVVVLHASLAMSLSRENVLSAEANNIGYQIGERIYTVHELQKLSMEEADSDLILSLGMIA